MKIILPMAALGLLSTLFLISDSIDPTNPIPITEIDLTQRAQDQGATNAAFAGVTSNGDEVMIAAQTAVPSPTDQHLIKAQGVTAQLILKGGTVVDLVSQFGDMHQGNLTATLIGEVVIETTTKYVINSDLLKTQIDELYAESPGPVTGHGPPGDLSAGRLLLTNDDTTGVAQLLFTDGVKLVYTPQSAKDNQP